MSRYYSAEPRKSLRTKKDEDIRAPPNIIVIGAGFAGLAAAQDLTALGYKVTVLEVYSIHESLSKKINRMLDATNGDSWMGSSRTFDNHPSRR